MRQHRLWQSTLHSASLNCAIGVLLRSASSAGLGMSRHRLRSMVRCRFRLTVGVTVSRCVLSLELVQSVEDVEDERAGFATQLKETAGETHRHREAAGQLNRL